VRICQDCGRECDPAQGEIKPKGRSCRECIRQRRNAYHRAYHPGYYQRNRERILKQTDAYRIEHRDEILAKQREWSLANAEYVRREVARLVLTPTRSATPSGWPSGSAANPGKQQEYQRIHYARKRLNPQEWAEYLEESRLRARLKAEQEGRPFKPVSLEEYRERYGGGWGRSSTLPAEPLIPFIRRALHVESEIELAERAGISDKRIRDVLNGNAPNIALVTADKLCVALGYTLSLIYPEAA
jgi:DNA-binding Xre family transcriptional regulator